MHESVDSVRLCKSKKQFVFGRVGILIFTRLRLLKVSDSEDHQAQLAVWLTMEVFFIDIFFIEVFFIDMDIFFWSGVLRELLDLGDVTNDNEDYSRSRN